MNFYNFDINNLYKHSPISVYADAKEILLNDDNLKPRWVEQPAQYSEFHIKRGKKSITVVIGESWTYGEAVKGIATALNKFSLETQLRYMFGPQIALTLGTDYYQYAVPGNCNLYMFESLERIINYVSKFNYEEIYLCMQLTEPGRELAIAHEDPWVYHPIQSFYFKTETIDIREWLKRYDEMFFDIYERILTSYSNLNIKPVLWKNFCKTVTDKRDYKFKIIEDSWIRYSGKIVNVDLDMPDFYAIGWLDSLQKDRKYIQVDPKWANDQFDIIEKSNSFLKGNPLHNVHPNEYAHLLWSQYIIRKAGWKNDI